MLENGKDLAKWLETLIPDLDDENGECSWGFYKISTEEFINRHLDIRSFTLEDQGLFIRSIFNGRTKFLEFADEYSSSNIDFFEIFY